MAHGFLFGGLFGGLFGALFGGLLGDLDLTIGGTGTAGNDLLLNVGGQPDVDAGSGDDIIVDFFAGGSCNFIFNRSSGNDQLYGYQPELDRILLDGFSPREVVMNEGEANGREYIDIVAGGLAGTASDAIHVRVWDVANHSDIHLVLG